MPDPEPLCWWCDEPAKRVPLVPRHGTWFHRRACVAAFETANPVTKPRARAGRRAGEELAPLRDRRLSNLLDGVRGTLGSQ